MDKKIIETFDLSKKYKLKGKKKEVFALNKVNISIKEGEIFGLLGPNGAGKTTMIQILTTLIQPTSGYAIIDGFNVLKKPKQIRRRIGLMLGSEMLYYRLTAYDNLCFFSEIYNIPNYKKKIIDLSNEFGLETWLNQYVENFSSGMKMKLALVRTLLLNPKILFLDEPTLGLDVKTKEFIVNKLQNINKTIFLCSHDMNLVDKVCDRVGFINKGKILKIGTKGEIKKVMEKEIKVEIEINENKSQLKSEINHQQFTIEIIDTNKGFIIFIKDRKYYKDLLSILSKYSVLRVNEEKASIEELFIKII